MTSTVVPSKPSAISAMTGDSWSFIVWVKDNDSTPSHAAAASCDATAPADSAGAEDSPAAADSPLPPPVQAARASDPIARIGASR